MRLEVGHKQKLTKTDKQKKADRKKKDKGPKLNKYYTDDSDYDIESATIPLTKMRYGVIRCCNLLGIQLDEGYIELSDSWIEALIIMLDNLITSYPDNFVSKLLEYEITNMFICVDNVYGKYTFEGEQYKAYKIFNTGYYLELIETSGNIFNAIVGLTRCLGIPFDKIHFKLRNKNILTLNDKFNTVTDAEYILNIIDAIDDLERGIHIIGLSIFEEIVAVHRLDACLVAFCNALCDRYGLLQLSMLPSNASTGICEFKHEDEGMVKIRDTDIAVYTDGDILGILKFMIGSMKQLGIDNEQVKFKFRALKISKEWEVD